MCYKHLYAGLSPDSDGGGVVHDKQARRLFSFGFGTSTTQFDGFSQEIKWALFSVVRSYTLTLDPSIENRPWQEIIEQIALFILNRWVVV